ncbi:flavin reductase (NADPH)-like isoform X3 [Eriocheir sinensis]|uniref:flavin reductase (NADPH)-like isoform X3 n=1 Tax=Eriocheir sinensis TaxID=95602 RepID=UPI0021C98858|nr:flavin reductase (NADPH)-like isoform X3 [Eriocheir sinensis]
MKVVIFGATGNTGLCCTRAAVKLGYKVTTFVRDPARLPEELSSQVTIKAGDVLDSKAVDEAVENQDAVVILLGTRNDLSPTTMMSDGTKNILAAMKKHGVKRVSACLSAFNFREKAAVPERFYHLLEDHERILEALKASNLEWVAVLPPHITDDEARGDFVVQHGSSPGHRVSKNDLGHFMVSCLSSDEHLYKQCGICDKPQS